MQTVLILAREEVVATLLGLLAELHGLQPLYPEKGESADAACKRTGCKWIVIDCDHRACTLDTLSALNEAGVRIILFSRSRITSQIQQIAGRYDLRTFTLPIGPDAFGRLLEE